VVLAENIGEPWGLLDLDAVPGSLPFVVDGASVVDFSSVPVVADATPCPVTMAVPTPRATARPPTRPI
jgi:hypothetical protein